MPFRYTFQLRSINNAVSFILSDTHMKIWENVLKVVMYLSTYTLLKNSWDVQNVFEIFSTLVPSYIDFVIFLKRSFSPARRLERQTSRMYCDLDRIVIYNFKVRLLCFSQKLRYLLNSVLQWVCFSFQCEFFSSFCSLS